MECRSCSECKSTPRDPGIKTVGLAREVLARSHALVGTIGGSTLTSRSLQKNKIGNLRPLQLFQSHLVQLAVQALILTKLGSIAIPKDHLENPLLAI